MHISYGRRQHCVGFTHVGNFFFESVTVKFGNGVAVFYVAAESSVGFARFSVFVNIDKVFAQFITYIRARGIKDFTSAVLRVINLEVCNGKRVGVVGFDNTVGGQCRAA